jgi:hypothetical protein
MAPSVITQSVLREHGEINHRWKQAHLNIRPFSLKGKFTRDLGLKSFEIVNSGSRYSLRVARVRKGKVYTRSLSPDCTSAAQECMVQYSKFELHNGVFSNRLFAQLVVKLDGVSVTLFSKKIAAEKNISISGPSHAEISLTAASKFFHIFESVSPPPVADPGSAPGTPPEVLSIKDDYYKIWGKTKWTTNEVVVASLGDKLRLWDEGMKNHPDVLASLPNLDDFPGRNLYLDKKISGCSSMGVFPTATATFLNIQPWFCLRVRRLIDMMWQHVIKP